MVCSLLHKNTVSLSVASSGCLTLSWPLSLPPMSHSLHLHVIHPSSPSAHPIIKSFSSSSAKSFPCSSSPPRLLFIHSLPQYFQSQGSVSLSRRHCYLWSIGNHSAGLYALASAVCQFNTLLLTLRPMLSGSQDKSDSDRLDFSSLQRSGGIFLCMKEAENQPHFDSCHVIILDVCVSVRVSSASIQFYP